MAATILILAALLVILVIWLAVARRQHNRDRVATFQAAQALEAITLKCAESLEKETHRANTYLAKITDFEQERNQWKQLYYAEALMHGNAQQLLLSELSQLQVQFVRATKGKQPRVSQLVQALTEDYAATHPTPNPPADTPPLAAEPEAG